MAPVLIENNIKQELPFLSNVMVIGEARKYLTVILTLKHLVDQEGKLIPNELSPDVIPIMSNFGINEKKIKEAI